MKPFLAFAALLLSLALGMAHAAPACTAHSAPRRTHLLTLYTSEGCSSCPPAERWLGGVRASASVVPLELHVDYWDALGWRDRFGDARFTARQYAMAARDGQRTVYTPEVALDGHEWRDWRRSGAVLGSDVPGLDLDLVATPGHLLQVTLRSRPRHDGGDHALRAFIAVTEDGLASRVGAGENAGRLLRHRHTVRAFAGPLPLHRADARLRLPSDLLATRSAVVAFVQNMHTGTVLQVVRLPLGACMTTARHRIGATPAL